MADASKGASSEKERTAEGHAVTTTVTGNIATAPSPDDNVAVDRQVRVRSQAAAVIAELPTYQGVAKLPAWAHLPTYPYPFTLG